MEKRNRRRFLLSSSAALAGIAGCISGSKTGGQSQANDQSDRIDLKVNGRTSTGIPPLTTAIMSVDISSVDTDDIGEDETIRFQLRNTDTGEQLKITPERNIIPKLISSSGLDLTFVEPTAEISPEPNIQFGLDEEPVRVSGDTGLLRTQTVVNTLQFDILDVDTPLFETPPRQVGTQFLDGFVQTGAGETLRYELHKPDFTDVDIRLEIDEVLKDSDRFRNQINEMFEIENNTFVVEIDRTELTANSQVDFRSINASVYRSETEPTATSRILILSADLKQNNAPAAYTASIGAVNDTAMVGEQLTIEYSVINMGKTTGSENSAKLSVVPETDSVPDLIQDRDDIGELSPGGTTSGTLNYTPTETDQGELRLIVSSGDGIKQTVADTTTVSVGQ